MITQRRQTYVSCGVQGKTTVCEQQQKHMKLTYIDIFSL